MTTNNNVSQLDYVPHTDTKTKHYIQKSVYTAAKDRIKDAINQSDNHSVLWSGGKDSTVTAHLVCECHKEMNITEPVNLIFMDEEVINLKTVEYIHSYEKNPDFKVYWLNIPILCTKHNTGKTVTYTQNDTQRRHVRDAPQNAYTLNDFNIKQDTVLTRYQISDIQAGLFKGKVCLFKGIRTDESLFRLTQVLRRKQRSHIGKHTKKHFECVPVYDWKERDIFLYFYKNKIPYNTIYDDLLYGGAPLRVSTPMHQYNTQTFNNLRKIDPELYENIGRVFPDMLHADKYPNIKTAKNPDFNNYPHTINGLMQYIEKCYQDKPRTIVEVKKKVLWAYKKRQKNKQRPNSDIFGGYPLLHLFNIVRRGAIERNITPAEKPGKNCYTFEGYTIQDYEKDKQKRGQYTCNQ